jgi:hypothetical protein
MVRRDESLGAQTIARSSSTAHCKEIIRGLKGPPWRTPYAEESVWGVPYSESMSTRSEGVPQAHLPLQEGLGQGGGVQR